jgi:hypothetical protein
MRIAPTFIFALLMSTAASGQVFEDIWTNAGQNISYEISDSGDTITFIDEGNAEEFRGCPGCGFPGDPCGCEFFDVTIVSEGPSLVRVDLYGEYENWFDFYDDYGYPPLLTYATYDQGLNQWDLYDAGELIPTDLSTRYFYFQDRFTFQLQRAPIASAEIELISLGDKFVPGDFDGDGDHDIDDYNASGAALGLCAADANRDAIVDFGDLLIVINDWGTTCE